MTERIITDSNGRKHITTEPLLHLPQRPWVGLTDEEAISLWENTHNDDSWELIKRVEAKLEAKNL